ASTCPTRWGRAGHTSRPAPRRTTHRRAPIRPRPSAVVFEPRRRLWNRLRKSRTWIAGHVIASLPRGRTHARTRTHRAPRWRGDRSRNAERGRAGRVRRRRGRRWATTRGAAAYAAWLP